MANENNKLTNVIDCQIGLAHGTHAATQVKSSIEFYADLFQQTAAMSWDEVKTTALQFQPHILAKWPSLLEEMQGLQKPDPV